MEDQEDEELDEDGQMPEDMSFLSKKSSRRPKQMSVALRNRFSQLKPYTQQSLENDQKKGSNQ